MRDLHLHGKLGAEFGSHFQFEIDSVPEAIQALRANFPTFASAIRNGYYRVVVGKSAKTGLELDEQEAASFRLGNQPLHIVPVLKGRKRGGIGKIISGIALVGLSITTGGAGGALAGPLWSGGTMTGGQLLGQMGAGMLMTGVASLLVPEMSAGDEKKSFTMSGPQSNLKEGTILPIAYGEVISGGYMITGGVRIKDKSNTSAKPASGSKVKTAILSVYNSDQLRGGSLTADAVPGGSAPPIE